jgi:hypothetical protein
MGKLGPWQKNAMAALVTSQSDIRAEPRNRPFITATGVRSSQSDNIVETHVQWGFRHIISMTPAQA